MVFCGLCWWSALGGLPSVWGGGVGRDGGKGERKARPGSEKRGRKEKEARREEGGCNEMCLEGDRHGARIWFSQKEQISVSIAACQPHILNFVPVSYTHLTLPTICSV